jgi:hypothetical protein
MLLVLAMSWTIGTQAQPLTSASIAPLMQRCEHPLTAQCEKACNVAKAVVNLTLWKDQRRTLEKLTTGPNVDPTGSIRTSLQKDMGKALQLAKTFATAAGVDPVPLARWSADDAMSFFYANCPMR